MKLASTLAVVLLSFLAYSQKDSIKVQEIEEVTISAIPRKEIAFKSPRHFIMDFHIDSTGTFLLLKRFKKYYIRTLNYLLQEEFEMELVFHPKSLFMDCMGTLHVLSKNFMYELKKENDKLSLGKRYPIRYHEYIKDCVATNDQGLIFKIDRYNNQSTEYYQVAHTDSSVFDIYTVENRELKRSMRETQKEIRREEERLRRKYDGSVNQRSQTWEEQTRTRDPRNGAGVEIRAHLDNKRFYNTFILRPYYNPLFVRNDTTYVFDHINGKMIRISEKRNILNTCQIDYQHEKKWKGEMHLDIVRGNFYSIQEKHGAQIFGLIAMDSVNIIRRSKLTRHPYPKKVIVYNGFAYYVYKEYVNDNLNKLFRQRL